jgi:hypothetical protein
MSISVTNTDAQLSASTLLTEEDAATIEALHEFDRDPNPPFAVSSGSDQVANLRAERAQYAQEPYQGQFAFPATQNPSSDANTLDDYEEGSFTPTVASSGGGTPTYTTQVGRYVKVGKEVRFSLWVVLASKGTLVAGGNVTIEGLPFTAANIANLYHSCTIGQYQSATTAYVNAYAYVAPATSVITLTFRAAAAASAAVLLVSDIGATSDFMISGSFFTD